MISVIIPVYNSENYLWECVSSVQRQTYSDLQILIIEDGSTDGSGAICDALAAKDSRIRVIHQENHGVSHARNRGLELASGDAVSFVDSDDTLEPDMYELLMKTMQEHEADVAHCGFYRVENGQRKPVYGTGEVIVQNCEQSVGMLLEGKRFNGALWNKLFSSRVLEGIRFREDLRINEDVLFCFEAFMNAQKTVFTDAAKYNYFVRENVSACFVTPDEKKQRDGLQVSAYIYERTAGTELEVYAAERYLRALSAQFRRCEDNRKQIARRIWDTYRKCPGVSRNMRLTAMLIRYVPGLYRVTYGIYDTLRKPVWEV